MSVASIGRLRRGGKLSPSSFVKIGEGSYLYSPSQVWMDLQRRSLAARLDVMQTINRGLDRLVFFAVEVRQPVHLDELREAEWHHEGQQGLIHGVEHEQGAGPLFDVGARLLLMLWLPHSSPSTRKPKADKGRPKPRLDYPRGKALVLAELRRDPGHGFDRGELEKATGFSACQVRTFCKRLEGEGLLRREGVGRGVLYFAGLGQTGGRK